MKEFNKQQRIQMVAMQLFQSQGIESTSVNDIVRKANVAKGTFYIYYKDKRELITQILSQKHGYMLNDLLHLSLLKAQSSHTSWKEEFIEALISYYEQHPDILKMIQKHVTSFMETNDQREQVFSYIDNFKEFLDEMKHENEHMQDTSNRFMLMMEIAGIISHNAIFYEMPAPMRDIRHLLIKTLNDMIA